MHWRHYNFQYSHKVFLPPTMCHCLPLLKYLIVHTTNYCCTLRFLSLTQICICIHFFLNAIFLSLRLIVASSILIHNEFACLYDWLSHSIYCQLSPTRIACWQSTRLVIERLWVQIPAGAAGEFSFPELTFCADSYLVSWCLFHPCVTTVACKRPGHSAKKCRWQVTPRHADTLYPMKTEWADYAVIQA